MMDFSCLGCVATCPYLSLLSAHPPRCIPALNTASMHRDAGHEIASQLVRYELTVARYELCRVGVAEILSGLLRGQVRELLGYQVMILRESLELLMRLLKLLLRLLQQRRIDLLGIRLRLLPSSNGLADPVCCDIDSFFNSSHTRRVLQRQRLRRQLWRQKLQQRLQLKCGLLLHEMLPVRHLRR